MAKQSLKSGISFSKPRKTVFFGDLVGFKAGESGTGAITELPQLSISSDGKWIAGGEVRFYLWDAETGENRGSDADFARQPKIPLSSLTFASNSTELLVGQEGRIRVYDIQRGLREFVAFANIENFPAPLNQPNIVATRKIDGQLFAILRKVFLNENRRRESGLELVKLDIQTQQLVSLTEMPGFIAASFENDQELLAVSRFEGRALVRHNFNTQQTTNLATVASGIRSGGRSLADLRYFNEVFTGANGEILVQWNTRNQLDPSKRDYSTMGFPARWEAGRQFESRCEPNPRFSRARR